MTPTTAPERPLIQPGESPEDALRRLEREDVRLLGTDGGQALLAECARRADMARRMTRARRETVA